MGLVVVDAHCSTHRTHVLLHTQTSPSRASNLLNAATVNLCTADRHTNSSKTVEFMHAAETLASLSEYGACTKCSLQLVSSVLPKTNLVLSPTAFIHNTCSFVHLFWNRSRQDHPLTSFFCTSTECTEAGYQTPSPILEDWLYMSVCTHLVWFYSPARIWRTHIVLFPFQNKK